MFSFVTLESLCRTDLSDWLESKHLAQHEALAPLELYANRQMAALRSKNVDLPGNDAKSRKELALNKFLEAEAYCQVTNLFLNDWIRSSGDLPRTVIGEAVNLAHSILGELDQTAFDDCMEHISFGPGMTFSSSSKSDASLIKKIEGVQTATVEAVPYMRLALRRNPSFLTWMDPKAKVIRGNRITTVPKSAEVDRTIAIEPSCNMFLQKGVDFYMRNRLARYGVDLTDQTRGWPLARQGSIDGSYATIDLSSASDTISQAVVRHFLPSDWYTFLDDIRSKEYTLDKGETWSSYSKFSSMGNSFTFPLETLIFFSLARSAADLTGGGEVVCYGDDIIVPQRAYLLTIECLNILGFIPNVNKSFGTGKFRETCGKDFMFGVDVRPVYVKTNPRNEVEVYNLYNRFLNNRQGVPFLRVIAYLYSLVPNPAVQPQFYGANEDWFNWRPFESSVYDAGFMVPESMAPPAYLHPEYQTLVRRLKLWGVTTGRFRYEGRGLLPLALYTGSSIPIDVGRSSYRVKKRTVSHWYWGIPWFQDEGSLVSGPL